MHNRLKIDKRQSKAAAKSRKSNRKNAKYRGYKIIKAINKL